MRISKTLLELGQKAKHASNQLRLTSTKEKNQALHQIAKELKLHQNSILKANQKDIEDGKAADLSDALLDRLSLEGGRLDAIIADVEHVIELPDPVGEILEERVLPNGLKLQKRRVPIGVLGVIYESRPNVTVDVATLALKTGNCAILRGGKETLNTNRALAKAIQTALGKTSLPKESIQLIKSPNRSQVKQLLKLDTYVDMIIPRGGEGLHHFCREHSMIPVITGGMGICHLFVDQDVDQKKAIEVIVNAKTQRPSVCNALDTLLIHKKIAASFLPELIRKLREKNVCFRLDSRTWEIIDPKEESIFKKATQKDWQTEWMSLILGIKIVDSLEEAIMHIQECSTGHSDGILTNIDQHAKTFIQSIDSAAVYVNASTRFTDGGQFGLGAEVAVSTQKLHARGPMGLKELTSYKWIIEGEYQVR